MSDEPALVRHRPWWILPVLVVLASAAWLAASDHSPLKNAAYTAF